MEEHLAPFLGRELRFEALVGRVVAEALDDGEAGNLGGAPDREGCHVVGRDRPGDALHRQQAAFAVLIGKNQTDGADGVAGGVVGKDRMGGMAVEAVALKPVRAVGRVLEPVVQAVDLKTNAETFVFFFGRIGNRRRKYGVIIF